MKLMTEKLREIHHCKQTLDSLEKYYTDLKAETAKVAEELKWLETTK